MTARSSELEGFTGAVTAIAFFGDGKAVALRLCTRGHVCVIFGPSASTRARRVITGWTGPSASPLDEVRGGRRNAQALRAASAGPGNRPASVTLWAADIDRRRSLDRRWASSGTPPGDLKHLPPLPKFADGWLLGQPDLIVKPEKPFTLPAQQADAFRIFAIRVPVKKRTYVTGIEFHPGNARVVHHANIRIDRTNSTRRLMTPIRCRATTDCLPRSAEFPTHFLGGTQGQSRRSCSPSWHGRSKLAAISCAVHMQPSGEVRGAPGDRSTHDLHRRGHRQSAARLAGHRHARGSVSEPRLVRVAVDVERSGAAARRIPRERDRARGGHADGTSRLVMPIKTGISGAARLRHETQSS